MAENCTAALPVVLLVEDNADDEILTGRALAKTKIVHELVVAQNGNDALDYLWGTGRYQGRDPLKSPSVILLDLKLPGMSGHEVLRRIRADVRSSEIPVVVMSSSTNSDDRGISYECGADSFVSKDIDFVKFQQDIRMICIKWLA